MLVMYDAHLDIEQDLNTHRSKYASYKTRYAQKNIIKGDVYYQLSKVAIAAIYVQAIIKQRNDQFLQHGKLTRKEHR